MSPVAEPPAISVVVASHRRPLRLRWLLNALLEQTLDPALWEVVVGHDSGEETERMLRDHPLARDGRLRHARLDGDAPPGANRNAALTLARAPVIAFTDDDCRPPAGWLQAVHAAVRRHPGAAIQGPVASDPEEDAMLRSGYPRTQQFADVPRPWAECANIVYPRSALDAVGGFAEDVRTGEDTDLNLRVRARGVAYVGDAGMLTYHAVEEGTVRDWVRGAGRWGDLAMLVTRHPEIRRELFLGVFWKPTHAWLLLATGGVVAAAGLRARRRHPGALLLVLPWALARPVRGGGWRGALRHVAELPGYAVIDLVELSVLARASRRARRLLL